jgi:cobalt/nickel transport protein
MKKSTIVICLFVLVLIVIVPLMTLKNAEFGGADGEAEGVIEEVAPDYEPWFESVIELPSGEVESLLFCLQAALGSGIVCYGIGYLVARSKYSNRLQTEEKREEYEQH